MHMSEDSLETANVLHSPEWEDEYYDLAMAFGQGPTLEVTTKKKASEAARDLLIPIETEVNTWGRTTAVAMGYLAYKRQYRDAIYSGGRTGGEEFPSEARFMHQAARDVFGQEIRREGFDEEEERSTNTLENFVHSLNRLDELAQEAGNSGKSSVRRMVFVCSDFHATRIKLMASLFNLHDVDVLSSEQILRIMVSDPNVPDEIIEKAADVLIGDRHAGASGITALTAWIDSRINPLNVGVDRTGMAGVRSFVGGGTSIREANVAFTPYEKATERFPATPEGITHTKRMKNEDMFIEGLAAIPANWLGFLSDIKSDTRLKGVIDNLLELAPDIFSSLSIDPNQPLDALRQALKPFQKAPLRMFVSLDHTTYNENKTPPRVEALLTHRDRRRGKTT